MLVAEILFSVTEIYSFHGQNGGGAKITTIDFIQRVLFSECIISKIGMLIPSGWVHAYMKSLKAYKD